MRTKQISFKKNIARTLLSIPLALIATALFVYVTEIAPLESYGGVTGYVILIFVLWTSSASFLALCRKADGTDWLEATSAGLFWAFLFVAIPAAGFFVCAIYSLINSPGMSI